MFEKQPCSLIYIHHTLYQWIKQLVDMTYNSLHVVIVGQTLPQKIAIVEQLVNPALF